MNITIRHRFLRSHHALDTFVEEHLLALAQTTRIEDASVLLERRAEQSPAFRAEVCVKIPGPDLRAEAVDHTVANAVRRALAELKAKLDERAFRRARRVSRHRKNPVDFRMGRRSR